jgi:hypothetical protein
MFEVSHNPKKQKFVLIVRVPVLSLVGQTQKHVPGKEGAADNVTLNLLGFVVRVHDFPSSM